MPKRAAMWVAWLISAAAGLVEIYFAYEIAQLVYALLLNPGRSPVAFGSEYYTGVLVGNVAAVVAAVVWVAWVIGGGEYIRRRAGARRAWIALAVAAVVQALIALVYLILQS